MKATVSKSSTDRKHELAIKQEERIARMYRDGAAIIGKLIWCFGACWAVYFLAG